MEHLENFRLHEIKQEIEAESGQITEEQLNGAIARGLNRGKKKAIRRQIGFQVGFMTALMTLSIFLLSNWAQDMKEWGQPPAQSVVQGSFGDIPEHVLAQMTSDMETAAEHGLYQPVNRSEQTGPYQVTVDGVLADQQQLYLFITLTNLSGKSTPMELADYGFYDPGTERYPRTVTAPAFMANDKYKTVQHLTYALSYDTTPAGKIILSGKMKSEGSYASDSLDFEIPVEWNPDIYKKMARIIPLDRTEVIQGHSLTLNHLLSTPLATKLSVTTESEAGTGIEGFTQLKLMLDYKQEAQFVQAIYPKSSEYRYATTFDNPSLSELFFGSLYYRDISDITFQASGITLNTYQPFEIIVDTHEKELKSAPANFKLLSVKENQAQEVEVQLVYNSPSSDPDSDSQSFKFDSDFVDQKGKSHSFLKGGHVNNVISLTIDASSYPQPLTFTGKQVTQKQIKHAMQWEFSLDEAKQ